MGIINVTPDSFFSGSRHQAVDDIVREAETMLHEGASILDIGGQSTRPGSEIVAADEELKRIIKAVEKISSLFPEAFISVDTYYAKVANEAVAAGACIVNDISAGSMDPDMLAVTASLKVPYVLMHMKGTQQTMQSMALYEDVTKEVLDFFIKKIAEIRNIGITDIIVDPGFGFAKTISHNFELLRNLKLFAIAGCPLMAGLSRKSTVWKTLGIDPGSSLNGTTVLNSLALVNGAQILRVHDVKEAVEAVKLLEAYNG
jgi:dihydropteroate synthase